ncbi:PaaI family thioesterase [Thermoactinomyces sp. CICC 10521]|uniref:PaaI family thioesterase n=1 Tax=Thermoactinomyces daqus TaxID=1329516 RepID=A0A7W1XBN3_9BACL|nr:MULTISPECIES: PaaI family thioesterase [unclassified Thermoactinomyces]MBA4543693.1 PaaI family thioesterase [Thermoactinomyces daqus]MBH8597144.1 PaaI family thioesterase [Thermoactinomyces sp. CICC 10523]MBH8602704.1 PaaI family thioesterase [Thermoactinomyces sp. CICC 10522]MBH8606185.1 PaaI family thioesterase [Thermoactinomyces sp. CICC 10521]
MADELREVLENGTEEEKEVLALALQAIRQKRERNSAYLSGFLGLSGRFIEEKVYEFRVPITPFMLNRRGIVHGGIAATLADSTMGSCINRLLPEGSGAVTAELKINYLKPGTGKMLISRAELLHLGRTLAVLNCEITNEKGKRICYATATFYLLPKGK